MTLFEYLAVAYSIVLSLAVVRLLGGLPVAMAHRARYWVHAAWIGFVLLRALSFWWSFWSYREVVSWNFFSFALVLVAPGLLYVMAAALVPDTPSSVSSWRDHYFAVHRQFFTTQALSVVAVVIQSVLVLGVPLLHPLRGSQLLFVVLALVGATTKNPRIHAVILVVAVLVYIPLIVAFFLQPGQMVSSP